jgi:hypothetical protein
MLIVKVLNIYNGKIEVVSFETESGRKRTIGVVKFDVNDANSLVRGHMWYHIFGSNTTGATNGAGTAYPPQTPAFSHACLLLRFTDSDYPFGIAKLFFGRTSIYVLSILKW